MGNTKTTKDYEMETKTALKLPKHLDSLEASAT